MAVFTSALRSIVPHQSVFVLVKPLDENRPRLRYRTWNGFTNASKQGLRNNNKQLPRPQAWKPNLLGRKKRTVVTTRTCITTREVPKNTHFVAREKQFFVPRTWPAPKPAAQFLLARHAYCCSRMGVRIGVPGVVVPRVCWTICCVLRPLQ